MSAASVVQAALVAALGAVTGSSGVHDGPPARASYPYAVIGDGFASDWSHKTGRGRELRLAVTIWDEGGQAARLHALIGAAEAAIEALPRDLPGLRVASLMFLRSRIARDRDGPWAGLIEYRMRVLETA